MDRSGTSTLCILSLFTFYRKGEPDERKKTCEAFDYKEQMCIRDRYCPCRLRVCDCSRYCGRRLHRARYESAGCNSSGRVSFAASVSYRSYARRLQDVYKRQTLDNSDHKLAIAYDEVTVTRRVYRSGESEYLINGTQVRLKDINELFYDTGVR